MNPEKFKQFPFRKKLTFIRNRGTRLAVRQHDQYQIYLYDLDKMIVEVWYAKWLLRKRVVKIEVSLPSDQLLEPYLEMIQLNLNE